MYPFNGNDLNHELVSTLFDGMLQPGHGVGVESPIPLCFGYSDFFVVDGRILERLAHVLGIFAAANVFAEVAIPTALLHVADQVVQGGERNLHALWNYGPSVEVDSLVDQFRSGLLLAHPVKPSLEADKLMEVVRRLTYVGS